MAGLAGLADDLADGWADDLADDRAGLMTWLMTVGVSSRMSGYPL